MDISKIPAQKTCTGLCFSHSGQRCDINDLVPYKMVFLNFYFIVVLVASFSLELLVWSYAVPCWGGLPLHSPGYRLRLFLPHRLHAGLYPTESVDKHYGLVELSCSDRSCSGGTHRPFKERGSGAEGTQSEPAGEQGKD